MRFKLTVKKGSPAEARSDGQAIKGRDRAARPHPHRAPPWNRTASAGIAIRRGGRLSESAVLLTAVPGLESINIKRTVV